MTESPKTINDKINLYHNVLENVPSRNCFYSDPFYVSQTK